MNYIKVESCECGCEKLTLSVEGFDRVDTINILTDTINGVVKSLDLNGEADMRLRLFIAKNILDGRLDV